MVERAVLGKGETGLNRGCAALERERRGIEREAAEITGEEATRAGIIEGKGGWSDVDIWELQSCTALMFLSKFVLDCSFSF